MVFHQASMSMKTVYQLISCRFLICIFELFVAKARHFRVIYIKFF
jgi:hypothetical protein